MRHLLSVLVFASIGLLPAACGESGGSQGDTESAGASDELPVAASILERGMGQEEVLDKLGEPRTRVTMGGGLERWTYYSYDEQGQIAAKTLIIFGEDGKVVEINDLSP